MKKVNAFLSVLFILLMSKTIALGQNFSQEFGFKSDNDSYLLKGQDRYYTNGLFLYLRKATNQQQLNKKLEKFIYEISAGQKMYNPSSGNRPNPKTHDRPFAALLYVGASTSFFFKNESVLKTELKIGTIGPKAFGKESQEFLHETIGFYDVNGWDHQIKNALALNASAQFTKLIYRNSNQTLDFLLETRLNFGTTFTNAGLGVLVRTGNINPLFNSATTNSQINNNSSSAKPYQKEFFFYTKPQLHAIAYDATVSGNLFNDDSEVKFDTRPLVFAQQIGLNYSSQRFTIDYSVIFKTREVMSVARAHQYGSIAMAYRFN
jgi:hypothetical protein